MAGAFCLGGKDRGRTSAIAWGWRSESVLWASIIAVAALAVVSDTFESDVHRIYGTGDLF